MSPSRVDSRSSDAKFVSRLEAGSEVRGVSPDRVDSRSPNAEVVSRLEARSDVRADPGAGSKREPKVKVSEFSGALSEVENPMNTRSPQTSATYSRLPNLI